MPSRKPKPLSDLDHHEAAVLANAITFRAVVYRIGDAEARSRAEIEEIGKQMVTDTGRPCLLYAVDPAGRAVCFAIIERDGLVRSAIREEPI